MGYLGTLAPTLSAVRPQLLQFRSARFRYRVRDAVNGILTEEFTITIEAAVATNVAIDAAAQEGYVGTAFSYAIPAATGGSGSYRYAFTCSLPTGLSYAASGRTISGTPSATGTPSCSITATDAADATNSATATFRVTIYGRLALASTDEQYPEYGSTVRVVLPAATGGKPTITYGLSCTLPSGVSFTASTRTIAGTAPRAFSSVSCTYTATDGNSNTVSDAFRVTVVPNVAISVSAQEGYVGTAFSYRLAAASGGLGSYSYAFTCSLPAGLSYAMASRTISGTPTATGTATCSITATDTITASSKTETFGVTIYGQLALAPVGDQSVGYGGTVLVVLPAATGGKPTITYGLACTLPSGVSFTASTRTIAGTAPSVSSSASCTYTATDGNSNTVSRAFTFAVIPSVSINAAAQEGYVGTAFQYAIPSASGGSGSYSYVFTCSLPTGLSYAASGRTITGTPSATGTPTCSITATDTADATKTATATFRVTIYGRLALAPVGDKSVGYGGTVSVVLPAATGGKATITYGLSCTLPSGVSFTASTRTIAGTAPRAFSSASCTYTATDGNSNTVRRTFTFAVLERVSINTAAQEGYAGTAFSYAIPAATGGSGSYLYVFTCSLPMGLSYAASGRTISGTPRATGTPTCSITATDAADSTKTATSTFRVTIYGLFALASVGNQSVGYGGTVRVVLPAATGGKATITYGLSCTLPSGVSFTASTRTIAGTAPSASSSASCAYTATDGNSKTVSRSFTFAVIPNVAISVSAQEGYVGTAFSYTIPSATGGSGSYRYVFTCSLPTGLSYAASGRTISGTPSATGTPTCRIKATDAADSTKTKTATFRVTIYGRLALASVGDQSFVHGDTVRVVLPAATGGKATITYGLACTLPSGITFTASSRRIAGTAPNAASSTSCTYTATDGNSNTVSRAFTFVVIPSVALSATAQEGYVRTAFQYAIPSATGGAGSYRYSFTCSLPTGLSYNVSRRTISGTPSATGTPTCSITATDTTDSSNAATATFRVTIYGQLALASVGDKSFVHGGTVRVVLPAATGGKPTITYGLACTLPSGVSFTASTRTIAGTAPSASSRTSCTYSATDGNSNTVRRTFMFVVIPSIAIDAAAQEGYVGTAFSYAIPAATGGSGSYRYAFTCSLPTGLSYAASGRTITGTPSATGTPTCSITATDAADASATATARFRVTIYGLLALASVGDQSFVHGRTVRVVLPAATGGKATITYGLSCTLPSGVSFTARTRTIAGTAPSAASSVSCTYSATDGNSNTVRRTFTFTVLRRVLISPSSQEGYIGTAFQYRIPNATGGSGSYRYSFTCSLPTGLSYAASGRTISGTPSATGTPSCSITATDTADSTNTTTSTFRITIYGLLALAPVGDQSVGYGGAVLVVLPAATGGKPTITYGLACTLPTGITFTASSRRIAGTAPNASSSASCAYTATDGNSNRASRTFRFAVATLAVRATPPAPDPTPTAPVLESWRWFTRYTVTFAAEANSGAVLLGQPPALEPYSTVGWGNTGYYARSTVPDFGYFFACGKIVAFMGAHGTLVDIDLYTGNHPGHDDYTYRLRSDTTLNLGTVASGAVYTLRGISGPLTFTHSGGQTADTSESNVQVIYEAPSQNAYIQDGAEAPVYVGNAGSVRVEPTTGTDHVDFRDLLIDDVAFIDRAVSGTNNIEEAASCTVVSGHETYSKAQATYTLPADSSSAVSSVSYLRQSAEIGEDVEGQYVGSPTLPADVFTKGKEWKFFLAPVGEVVAQSGVPEQPLAAIIALAVALVVYAGAFKMTGSWGISLILADLVLAMFAYMTPLPVYVSIVAIGMLLVAFLLIKRPWED